MARSNRNETFDNDGPRRDEKSKQEKLWSKRIHTPVGILPENAYR